MTNDFPLIKDGDGAILAIHVTPKASRNAIGLVEHDIEGKVWLRVRVTVPPEDGKANKAVIKLLSKQWKIPASKFSIISGDTARYKRLRVDAPYADMATWLKT